MRGSKASLASVNKTDEIRKRHEAYKAPVIDGVAAVIHPTPKGDEALDFAFAQYLRTGQVNADISDRYAQVEGTPGAGGYAVPDGFLNRLTEARTAFGGFINKGEQLVTATGNEIHWPSVGPAAATEADIAAEGASSAVGADIVFGEVVLGAYRYVSTGTGNVPVEVSVELLQDSTFDIAGLVARKLGERINRKQAYDAVRGSGSGEPLGIMYGTAGDIVTASGSVPTYVKLNDLRHALDIEYRRGAAFLMNDTTLGVIEDIVDSNGRPVIAPLTQGIAQDPDSQRLLGYPIIVDNAVANLSNNVQGIGFGNWAQAYIVRHVRDVQVLVNPYAATGYVVYDAWARMDATVQDATAYVTMEGLT